jgi:hypothetical protein
LILFVQEEAAFTLRSQKSSRRGASRSLLSLPPPFPLTALHGLWLAREPPPTFAMSSGSKCLSVFVRLFAGIVFVFGAALMAYGVWFSIIAKAFLVPSGVSLGLGLLDAAAGLALATCGYKSLCALRGFLLANGLVTLGELVIAVLFTVQATRQYVINDAQLPDEAKNFVDGHIAEVGYILLGVISVKVIACILVALQTCALSRGFDEDDYEAVGEAPLMAADIEATAIGRYEAKNKSVYEKYGLSRDGFRR